AKPAGSRVGPGGPSAERRRLCVSSASGFVWSMNCESCEEPKNSFTTADTGLALMRSCGIRFVMSEIDIRSLTARSIRVSPTRNWFSSSSPTDRTRRLPAVAPDQRRVRVLEVVAAERLVHRRVPLARGQDQQLERRDLPGHQLGEYGRRDLLIRLQQHLAALGVDDPRAAPPADERL